MCSKKFLPSVPRARGPLKALLVDSLPRKGYIHGRILLHTLAHSGAGLGLAALLPVGREGGTSPTRAPAHRTADTQNTRPAGSKAACLAVTRHAPPRGLHVLRCVGNRPPAPPAPSAPRAVRLAALCAAAPSSGPTWRPHLATQLRTADEDAEDPDPLIAPPSTSRAAPADSDRDQGRARQVAGRPARVAGRRWHRHGTACLLMYESTRRCGPTRPRQAPPKRLQGRAPRRHDAAYVSIFKSDATPPAATPPAARVNEPARF